MAALKSVPAATRGYMVLDSGALFALAVGDVEARAALLLAVRRGLTITIATVVLAQVIRGGPQDAAVNRVLKEIGEFTVITTTLARQAGVLLRKTATIDVVDALVATIALQQLPAVILTSDPGDLRTLVMADTDHPRVQIIAV